jgi:2-polyprenyl-6-methoxyphenol hydroxylase-like FAD-dependent oxidoreductase
VKRRVGAQAVVLGGSVAGLLAARALADYFDHVVVLERDPFPVEPAVRKGVPHARHTHGLLAGGLAAMEALFPGIRDDLVRRGAVLADGMARTRWHVGGDWHVQFESGEQGLCQSRPLLEQVIRQRLAGSPRIELRGQASVTGLVASPGRDRILGLRVTDRLEGGESTVPADLVVDATGRGSRTPQWMADLGYPEPTAQRIEVDLTYATRTYHRQPGQFQDNVAVVIAQSPPNERFAVAVAVEGDRWSVTLGGMQDNRPPADPDGFVDFALGLPSPVFHEFLSSAEPLSDVEIMCYPASVRRRYEWLARFPAGLLVAGDALCSFNPIYGQGMSVAALEACALGECLHDGTAGLARRYFRKAAAIVDVPWGIAVTADFRFPHVRGPRAWSSGIVNAYLNLVHRAAHSDPVVCLAFHRVANLLDPPRSLLSPRVLGRLARDAWRRMLASPRGGVCSPAEPSWSEERLHRCRALAARGGALRARWRCG